MMKDILLNNETKLVIALGDDVVLEGDKWKISSGDLPYYIRTTAYADIVKIEGVNYPDEDFFSNKYFYINGQFDLNPDFVGDLED
jgi:hypothetical protein